MEASRAGWEWMEGRKLGAYPLWRVEPQKKKKKKRKKKKRRKRNRKKRRRRGGWEE